MKKITVSIVTMLAALTLTAPVYAAGEYKGTTGTKTETGQSQSMSERSKSGAQIQSAEEILGMSVVARDGEKLGEIQDIKVDTRTGRVNYVTVQKGGVMGIGGEEGIAVPLEAFQFTNENAQLTVDKSKLDTAPKPSGMSDQEFHRDLQSHYGISPAWKEGQPGSSQSPQMKMDSGTQQKMDSGTQQRSQ